MRTILLLCFTLFIAYTFAQPRVVTFDSKQKESEPITETNSIKLHILEYLSKDYSLYYEKALLNKLSAEVGLGVTFGDEWGNIVTNTSYSPISPENKMGISLFGGVRFYPYEVFEDFYVALEYKYRKYKWEREVIDYSTSNQGIPLQVDEGRNHSMPRVTFGYVFYLIDNLTLDLHLGIGINTKTEILFNPKTYKVEKHKLNAMPRVNGVVKIGYVF